MITKSELKELLHYDPDTGVFTWLVAKDSRVKIGSVVGTKKTYHNTGKTYILININYKQYLAHRLAVLYMTGEFPEDQTDHIDGNGTNNRWSNLRSVSRSENAKNRRKPSNNKSGICGVHWEKSRLSWCAQIRIDSKIVKSSRFETLADAIEFRKKLEIEYGFHKNHGSTRPL